ncbi:lysine--tRNA ligase [Candidatus Woesearchaeota archaeon]|jgi:lysyl-tRNA synthetase, class I|nr:lysine--tRNA ligase [archaeon]MBT5023484.1 lysine--tRNA ligase [Candidatus Woesearchaeota archaeon]MBT4022595.1 lysine--tRNA ligase [archaeon]MBT4272035.1 lysine--tRNA ligase [archaeon]MBT4461132.1 lysine--tRNA ligase [archaeon]
MAKDKEVKHWADQIADEAIARVESDPFLQEVVKKTGYFVYDEKTPSGLIHIGSGRGWVIHDAIAKALRSKGVDAKFVLSSDDMDPLDKPSKLLTEDENERYLGVPFKYIPSPKPGYDSFGDYYFKLCTDKFEEFGIVCELESTGAEYEKGTFNKQIKIILDNADKVKKIFADLYGDDVGAANKLPFNVRCPKCGKIATTKALEWDTEKEEIKFECKDGVVAWAKGCNESGWISPYNGNGKFPWKVEWAAKWPAKGVIVETAGKDHFTKGGSRTVACRICVDVLNYPPPYPSKGYYTGPGYEFFTVGGKKMSTSKGRGIGFANSTSIAPAPMLRFLLVRTRPNAVIDFDPYGTNDIVLLYERYDKAERAYFGEEDFGEKDNIKLKRIYELSYIGKIPDRIPPQFSLRHASTLLQIYEEIDDVIKNLQESGHVYKDASKQEIEYVKERLLFAKKWIDEFAPEDYKFELQKKVPDVELNDKQRQALKILAEKLKHGKWTEQTLYNEFYTICRDEVDIPTGEFFQAAYKVLLNKERGPKLAGFLLLVREKAVKLFDAV